MLIEFSVSNYRSFREKQTFSMVAASRLGKKGNVFKPAVAREKLPDLLKVAAIYGPNASGKSNLIRALGVVNDIVRRDAYEMAMPLPVAPFRFDRELAEKPSRFEIHFIAAGQRYEFVLAAVPERIVEERLVAYPRGKETLLYSRIYEPSGEKYEFGEKLEGGPSVHETWRKVTSPKMLFISQAVANSNEELQQLRPVLGWLSNNLKTVPSNLDNMAKMALTLGNKFQESGIAQDLVRFLQEIDVPVSEIRFELKDKERSGDDESTVFKDYLKTIESDEVRSLLQSYNKVKATLTHKTALGEAEFDFGEESDGTRNLIGFHLPWVLMLSEGPNAIGTLVIDELDSSLHPNIVASLIEQLLSLDRPVQLIFTTHDTHLMNTKLLRRDQFWLTERDIDGATQLRSIHDFEGRESEDVEKRYYEGRYKGLPVLRKAR